MSMKPGARICPVPSTSLAAVSVRCTSTADIRPSRTATSTNRGSHPVPSTIVPAPPLWGYCHGNFGLTSGDPDGHSGAEFLAPAPHRLIGDGSTTLSQEQLSQAEAEHMVQPDGLADDLGRKTTTVVRVGWWFHAATVDPCRSGHQKRLP